MQLISEQPVNLLNATKEERQKFLDSFDIVFADCDGMRFESIAIMVNICVSQV